MPLQRYADSTLKRLLYPPGTEPFGFEAPPGEPALFPADSVTWRVFSNPVTLFVGGVAAVLLELAEPRVRHGVWDHTDFRQNPLERLQRTGLAAMVTVYAPQPAARAMIEQINRIHAQVSGVTPCGEPYRADDPELLRWVHVTAAFGFAEAYRRFGAGLGRVELDSYYAHSAPVAALYGAAGSPKSEAERTLLFEEMLAKLEPSDTLDEFLGIMVRVPALPWPARPAQRLLVRAGVDILPPQFSSHLLLREHRLRSWERPLVQAMGTAAGRMVLRSSPAVQACRRLGLSDDWLYRPAD